MPQPKSGQNAQYAIGAATKLMTCRRRLTEWGSAPLPAQVRPL
jgi:hypothetical protein